MRPTPDAEPRPTNRLAAETSAYLRQHMHNPVDWYPWAPEALERARREERPLLVSIGYSACHWCHVMERESFEDPETAALMNRLFVNVKVDREERPDVDQLYMDTVVRLTGHGGWPLTVFCTPDGRPFYGGTYFPPAPAHGRPSFRQVLEAVERAWRERRAEVEQSAGTILQALRARPRGVASALPGADGLVAAAHALLQGADAEHGGFDGAPKFPMPASLDGLLAAVPLLPAEDHRGCLAFVTMTCREMARRGLYDQLGGGFHRYCVDAAWTIPHFEKMLYDQGQLLRTYSEAFRLSRDPELVWPLRETVCYLRREMTAPEGGFFASQDADSEGEEGKYFVWRPQEIAAVLGPVRGATFCAAYDVTEAGNFEHGASHLVDVARRPRDELAAERAELLAVRRRRVPPATDTKRVAAWNALTISGLARAGSALDEPDWLREASAAADFVLARMRDTEGRLLRVFAEGRASVSAFLDDHAALLEACLDLQRAGADARFLAVAETLADEIARRFFDPDEGELFLTPADGERLPERPRADADGATPHSAGLAVLGLVRLGALSGRRDLEHVAERVMRSHAYAVERMPAAYPTLLRAAALAERGVAVAVIVGEPEAAETRALARRARVALAPEDAVVVSAPGAPAPSGLDPSWLAGREALGGRATAFLCRGTSCSLPIQEPEALAADAVPSPLS